MSRVRLIAAVLLVAGLGLGTITDHTPSRQPIRVDGYEVLSGDFHVHAFVGDGGLAPWMLQHQAARVGLDVVAITNHDQTLAGRLGRWAAQNSSGPLVLVGEEITGRNFHLVAVGIEQPVDWNQPVREAIAAVHTQGGVAIAAHPLQGFAEGYDEEALAALDGLEAAYSATMNPSRAQEVDDFLHRTLARNAEVAFIGSTDFHTDGPLGACRTYLFVRERSQAGVLDAIRDGRTVGYCETNPPGHGRLRGRPELVRLIEPCRDALAPPRETTAQRLAVVMVWVSLLALAVVGTRS
jgi:predicted metal-dependent phosphoesterase TrpH